MRTEKPAPSTLAFQSRREQEWKPPATVNGLNQDDSCKQAERLRAAVAVGAMKLADDSVTVAASFGVTTAPVGGRMTSEQLIFTADTDLLQAKRQGRNQVVSCPCEPDTGAAPTVLRM